MHEEELEGLMSEPPGGVNFGRSAKTLGSGWENDGNQTHRHYELGGSSIGYEEMRNGYHATYPGDDGTKGNPNGNLVHPDEYVDDDRLREKVEALFGFTVEEVASVYGVKKLKADRLPLREAIDSRVHSLYRAGGNMAALARVLDVNPRTMERALARAKAA